MLLCDIVLYFEFYSSTALVARSKRYKAWKWLQLIDSRCMAYTVTVHLQ